MSDVVRVYFLTQVLLSLACLIVLFLKKNNRRISSSLQLKLSYKLLAASLGFPLLFLLTPAENPFGQVVKAFVEKSSLENVARATYSAVQAQIPDLSGGSERASQVLPLSLYEIFLFFISVFLLFFLFRVLKDFKQVNQVLDSSYLIRKTGKVHIWLSDTISAPFSFFNGRAHIVLPTHLINDSKAFRISVLHELQHHRQKDTVWVYALQFIGCFFGLNPVVRTIKREIEENQELACDEILIDQKKLSPQLYGNCLYQFALTELNHQQKPVGAVGMSVESKSLKRRIENMLSEKKTTSLKTYWSVTALSAIVMATTAWAFQGAVKDQKISMSEAKKLAVIASRNQKIPVVVDKKVLYWLNRVVGSESSRNYMRKSLERMQDYKTMIVGQLQKAELPEELLAVPLIESGYRNKVVSPAKAAGIWQFIPGTARRCGLEVNSKKDERLKPRRLTEAAVCYYTKLQAVFSNWHLSLTAYNIGERRLAQVVSQQGHNDVLQLARQGHLGKEGGNYLPKLMAAMIILKNPELVQ